MSSQTAATAVIKPGKSRTLFLLFTGNRKQLVSIAKGVNIGFVAPLFIAIAAVLLFLITYAFFSGRIG
jgi:hypothetical protein